ncbi:MAG: hypothetical protein JWN61_2753 [Pseudonocardiales bacterium]|nr:hypothetical protein [Pseudonocardiales bacterium]
MGAMAFRFASTPQPIVPGPGQESVWDYPRPPACLPSTRLIVVRSGGAAVAESTAAFRVLETSHPPTWYVPRADVAAGTLRPSGTRPTWCEWKGQATYWDVVGPDRIAAGAAWSYESPSRGFESIAGYLAFDPAVLECFVDGEQARPQEGGFYAGWITDDVVGPFKGIPGSQGW